MDEIILSEVLRTGSGNHSVEMFLATVDSSTSSGVTLIFDGASEATTKRFKSVGARPGAGDRVAVLKQSGTYIVLGEINLPNSWKRIDDLANSATLADVIAKFNDLLAWLRTQGLLRT